MSHFITVVVGEDVEHQLQPFHEYECTGVKDEFVKFLPAKEDLEKEFEEHKKDYDFFEEFVEDYYGYIQENGVWGRYTNPNAKWDWWTIGGRWNGYFKLKDGSESNQALKSEIDLESALKESEIHHLNLYRSAREVINKIGTDGFLPWDVIKEKFENIDLAREAYHNQPLVKSFNEENRARDYVFGLLSGPEDFLIPEEEYVKEKSLSCITPYALVKDRAWFAQGEMGWFGVSSGDKDNWPEEFKKLWDELPDDTLLTAVDCHI